MCILTFFKPGIMPIDDHLWNGAYQNPDGHGWAIVAGDKILTGHAMDPDAAIESFVKARTAHPESYALFHSRWATHGTVGETNCHPFKVGRDPRTVLAHNGVLDSAFQPVKGDERSDTAILADWFPHMHAINRLDSRRARRRFRHMLGSYNKIAILTVDPQYRKNGYLINEEAGQYHEGIWYSNGYWRPYTPPSVKTYNYSIPWSGGTVKRLGEETNVIGSSDSLWDDEAWDQYLADARKQIAASQAALDGDCYSCDRVGTVNPTMQICRVCLTCADCFGDTASGECQCYMPDRPMALETLKSDSGYQETEEL